MGYIDGRMTETYYKGVFSVQRVFRFCTLCLILVLSACAGAGESGTMDVSNATVVLPGGDSMAGMDTASSLAGYFQITNNTGVDDQLLAVASDFADTMMHETQMNNDVASMKEIMSLEIPAGSTVKFESGGYHVMFMNPKQTLSVGDHVQLTLQFEKAGNITVDAEVVSR